MLVRRRRRTVVRTEDVAPHELLREPELEPEILDVRAEDGARLNVLAYGDADAPVLVFCHGWTCNAAYWTPQINAFAENYRVVVYDQRGHGDSEAGARPLGPTCSPTISRRSSTPWSGPVRRPCSPVTAWAG